MRSGLLLLAAVAATACQTNPSLTGTWKTDPDSGVTLTFPTESSFTFTTTSRIEGSVSRQGNRVVLLPTNVESGPMELQLSGDGKTLTKSAGPGTLRTEFKKTE